MCIFFKITKVDCDIASEANEIEINNKGKNKITPLISIKRNETNEVGIDYARIRLELLPLQTLSVTIFYHKDNIDNPKIFTIVNIYKINNLSKSHKKYSMIHKILQLIPSLESKKKICQAQPFKYKKWRESSFYKTSNARIKT